MLFAYGKNRFCHDMAHLMTHNHVLILSLENESSEIIIFNLEGGKIFSQQYVANVIYVAKILKIG